MVRWSSDVSLQEEYQFLGGSLDAELGVSGSVYDIQNTSDDTKHNGELGQVNPYVSLDWRALVSAISDVGVFMEPRAKFTHILMAQIEHKRFNRDASDFRLDEANLFLTHRQQGKDFVLLGTRADIGISFLADQTIFGDDMSGFGGISRRIAGETADGLTTTDNKDYSDYIANIAIKPL